MEQIDTQYVPQTLKNCIASHGNRKKNNLTILKSEQSDDLVLKL